VKAEVITRFHFCFKNYIWGQGLLVFSLPPKFKRPKENKTKHMKNTKTNPSDFISDQNYENPTEYFVKLPNRFKDEPWFNDPIKRYIFTELILAAKWKDEYYTFKNHRCIIRAGECIINQRELTRKIQKFANISDRTVNRFISFLSEIEEIDARKTNAFTLISITYLIEFFQNDARVSHECRTRNVKYEYLYEVIDGLDKVDKKDKINPFTEQINCSVIGTEINFKNENKTMSKVKALWEDNSVKEAEHDIVVKEKEVVKEKKPNIPHLILTVFKEQYLLVRKREYLDSGVDYRGCKSLFLHLYKKDNVAVKEDNLDDIRNYFREYFSKVLSIKDKYVYVNASPQWIYSKLNYIKTTLEDKSIVNVKLNNRLPKVDPDTNREFSISLLDQFEKNKGNHIPVDHYDIQGNYNISLNK
jgi:hypothetical protein